MTKCEPHKRNHTKGNMLNPTKNSCYGKFVETTTIVSDEKYPTYIVSHHSSDKTDFSYSSYYVYIYSFIFLHFISKKNLILSSSTLVFATLPKRSRQALLQFICDITLCLCPLSPPYTLQVDPIFSRQIVSSTYPPSEY